MLVLVHLNLDDPNQARLIAQCDIKDGVGQLINFNFDEDLLAPVPTDGKWS